MIKDKYHSTLYIEKYYELGKLNYYHKINIRNSRYISS